MPTIMQKIRDLTPPQASEAVKNLRLSLQYFWNTQIDEDQTRKLLESAPASGDAAALRDAIVSNAGTANDIDRWGKSLLLYTAEDPELRSYVEEAVDDALQSSSKDFGLSALIVLGVVLVLLKYRPTKYQTGPGGTKIEWKENDVRVVSDLAKAVSGVPTLNADKTHE